MSILDTLLGNALSSNPQSAGDLLANVAQQRANQNPVTSAIPKTTTIDQGADGSVTVTHEQKLDPQTAQAASANNVLPSSIVGPTPQANTPAMPVAPTATPSTDQQVLNAQLTNKPLAPVDPQTAMGQMPTPGAGTQLASNAPGAGVAPKITTPETQAQPPQPVAPGEQPQAQAQTPPAPNNAVLHPDAVASTLSTYSADPNVNPNQTPEVNAIHHAILNSPVNDGNLNALGMAAYSPGEHIDVATKKAYNDEFAKRLQDKRDAEMAQRKADDMIRNGGVGLQRELSKDDKEGSYIKAYLFHRLGLTDLAKNEQQKLGAGDQWQQTLVNGKPAWVKYNGQGAPVKGYTAEGELSGNQLIDTLGMKGAQTHTETYKDKTTGQLYQLQTTPLGPRYVGQNGQQYAGDTANLMAYGIGADVERKNIEQQQSIRNKNTEQLQTLRNRLLNEPKIEAANFLGKFNAENNTNYTLDQVINSQPAMTSAPGEAPVTGGGAAPSTPSEPVKPSTGTAAPSSMKENNNPGNIKDGKWAQSQPGYKGVAPNGTAVFDSLENGSRAQHNLLQNPTYRDMPLNQVPYTWAPKGDGDNDPAQYVSNMKLLTGFDDATMNKAYKDLTPEQQKTWRTAQGKQEHGSGSPSAGVNMTNPRSPATLNEQEPMRAPLPGESPAAYEAYKKRKAEEDAKLVTDRAKAKETLADNTSNAENMLTTINDVVTHPGFSTNVGVPGITGMLQLPGTQARNWTAKYNELKGKEFLEAFKTLKGGGSISDKEGSAATSALASLNDPGISEAEFKRNAQILQDTIKKGVNRQRVMAGEEPDTKYMLGAESDDRKVKAYNWAKSNPNNPKSRQIMQSLGLQ